MSPDGPWADTPVIPDVDKARDTESGDGGVEPAPTPVTNVALTYETVDNQGAPPLPPGQHYAIGDPVSAAGPDDFGGGATRRVEATVPVEMRSITDPVDLDPEKGAALGYVPEPDPLDLAELEQRPLHAEDLPEDPDPYSTPADDADLDELIDPA